MVEKVEIKTSRLLLRVMEKLGMTREGHLRSHYLEHGEAKDYYVYGILRKEWDSRKGNN